MEINKKTEPEKIRDIEGLAWGIWCRFYAPYLPQIFFKNNKEDLRQEIKLLTLIITSGEDFKKACKIINAHLYRFLVNYGAKKPRNSRRFVLEEQLYGSRFGEWEEIN